MQSLERQQALHGNLLEYDGYMVLAFRSFLNDDWFCRNAAEVAVGHGRIARKGMMEMGRGGAYVPARVALQGHIHRSSPAYNAYIFGMETPLRGRSGGHTGTAPTIPNTHRRSAKVKIKVLTLAELPQAFRNKK